MKKFKICALALSALFVAPIIANHVVSVATAEETTVVQADLDNANEAKDALFLNTDLTRIVSNIYLPSKGLYSARITWVSSDTAVITNAGVVRRPAEGSPSATVTLTATITVKTAVVTKEFECTVLPAKNVTVVTEKRFEETFNNYKTGQDLSNYFIWELRSGDEIAKISETVLNNNMIGSNKALDIEPLPTLYKDTVYQTKISMDSESVFETYVMYTGEISGFRFEFGNNSSTLMSMGIQDGNFVSVTSSVTSILGVADEGVWYKMRFELDPANNLYHVFTYDWKNNGDLVRLSPNEGIRFTAKTSNYFKFRVLTGRNDGHVYLSSLLLDERANMSANPETNPNRTKGIGKIENYTASYLLIQDEELTLNDFVIYNRFEKEEVLSSTTDYTITETYGANGKVNTAIVGDYTTTYVITLSLGSVTETKTLVQTFHVDPKDATADLTTLRIAPIVNDLVADPTVEKKIRLSADINRKDSTVYYAAVEAGSDTLTSQEVVAATKSSIKFSGNLTVTDSSFEMEIGGLDANKEYDFFVVTSNTNGVSETYIKNNISISVYNIETADDFFFMCTDPNVQTTNFRLQNDIDFADYYWAASEITRPEYKGTFDGQNHTISNLNIVAPYKRASLFYNFAGTFKNLVFNNCHLEGNESVGFVGGYGFGDSLVSNVTMVDCSVKCYSTESAGDGYYGLIFGRGEGGTTLGNVRIENINVENCSVDGPKYVGALVGNLQKLTSLTLNNVYCQATLNSNGAALGLISRARAPLTVTNTYADITVLFAKKEVAVICGHAESSIKLENVLGKLTVVGLTQPTYFNNLAGRYSTSSASLEFKNLYFFAPDTTQLSEDSVTPVSSSKSAGIIISSQSSTDQKWWETNTWFSALDTNANWGYDEALQRPVLRHLDLSTLSFTAAEVNAYIDAIGETITSDSIYYIRKARELYAYCAENEKSQVHMSVLEKAEADYKEYVDSLSTALDGADDIFGSITSGLDWVFSERSN